MSEIVRPSVCDYDELTDLWEASVRATHDFLAEEDIRFFKPLVRNQYLDAVSLFVIRGNEGRILAFMGIREDMLEMLFVHPGVQRTGLGRRLLHYAVQCRGISKVDVNEQNENALCFYERMGFEVTGRHATDAFGKPFPILHMSLKSEGSSRE